MVIVNPDLAAAPPDNNLMTVYGVDDPSLVGWVVANGGTAQERSLAQTETAKLHDGIGDPVTDSEDEDLVIPQPTYSKHGTFPFVPR